MNAPKSKTLSLLGTGALIFTNQGCLQPIRIDLEKHLRIMFVYDCRYADCSSPKNLRLPYQKRKMGDPCCDFNSHADWMTWSKPLDSLGDDFPPKKNDAQEFVWILPIGPPNADQIADVCTQLRESGYACSMEPFPDEGLAIPWADSPATTPNSES